MEDFVGRQKELSTIKTWLTDKLDKKKPGVIHLAGPPGTGKTLCVDYVLQQFRNDYNNVRQISINCMKIKTCKTIMSRICRELDIDIKGLSEAHLLRLLKSAFDKNFSILVLDELDRLPKSRKVDFIGQCVNWNIILIGISNIIDLSSRYEHQTVKRIIFKPYTSAAIKKIILWYIQNDENYFIHDESLLDKPVDVVAKQFATRTGDIRQALNAFKSVLDDATSTRCKQNLSTVATSLNKRERLIIDNNFTMAQQVLLTICARYETLDYVKCLNIFREVSNSFGLGLTENDFLSLLNILESQGLISVKKKKSSLPGRIVELRAGPVEIETLVPELDKIMQFIK